MSLGIELGNAGKTGFRNRRFDRNPICHILLNNSKEIERVHTVIDRDSCQRDLSSNRPCVINMDQTVHTGGYVRTSCSTLISQRLPVLTSKLPLPYTCRKILATLNTGNHLPTITHCDGIGSNCSAMRTLSNTVSIRHDIFPIWSFRILGKLHCFPLSGNNSDFQFLVRSCNSQSRYSNGEIFIGVIFRLCL